MDGIARAEMGNATSVFNLMRNLGGSMGIAAVQTLWPVTGRHTSTSWAATSILSPAAQAWLRNLQSAFIARGSDAVTAGRQALAAAFGMVQKQAAMISFIDAFRLLALIFLLLAPLALLLRRPEHQRGPTVAVGE